MIAFDYVGDDGIKQQQQQVDKQNAATLRFLLLLLRCPLARQHWFTDLILCYACAPNPACVPEQYHLADKAFFVVVGEVKKRKKSVETAAATFDRLPDDRLGACPFNV